MAPWATQALQSLNPAKQRRGALLLRLGIALAALAVTLALAPVLGFGARTLGIFALNLAYMLASLAIYSGENRSGRTRESFLGVVLDSSALTAALWMLDALWTPLVVLYLPTIALASLILGPGRGAIATLAATGSYGVAQLLVARGLAFPGPTPEILTASAPLGQLAELVSVTFVLGIGYLMSAVAARRLRAATSARIESEARARHLYESSPSLFAELDLYGQILFASPSHERVLGYSSSELAGRSAAELASQLEIRREIHDRDGHPEPLMSVRTRDGQRLLFEPTFERYVTASGEPRLIVVSSDVTARVRAHESLRSSEQRFRAVAEMTSDMIVEIDDAQRVVWRAPSFERLTAVPPERFNDRVAVSLVHPEDRESLERMLEASRTQSSAGPTLVRLRRGDGQLRWLEGHSRSLDTASGERHVLLVARDVTAARENAENERQHRERLSREVGSRTADLQRAARELRELRARLLHSERAGAEGHLAGQIAHAINTPLQVMLGTLQMRIEKSDPLDPEDERLLHLTRRVAKIVEDMFNLSRRGELSITRIRPEALLHAVTEELASRFGDQSPELCVRVAPETPDLMADENLLRIALAAVVENAIEASPKTSEIRLEAEGIARGRGVEFRILDRGSGIAEEVAPHVFEPFFSTKRSGTGLGLAVAAGAIGGHGGRIRTEARSGGGTCVRIEIHAHHPTPEATAEPLEG